MKAYRKARAIRHKVQRWEERGLGSQAVFMIDTKRYIPYHRLTRRENK
jgi:hypothetical protein